MAIVADANPETLVPVFDVSAPDRAGVTVTAKIPAVAVVGSDGVAPTGATALEVQGNIAHDAVDSGKPQKIGGKASLAAPAAVADGDRVDAWYGRYGQAHATVSGPTGALAVTSAMADTQGTSLVGLVTMAWTYVYNGAFADKKKIPSAVGRLPSAAATTNATVVKASAGAVFNVNGYNAAASVRYLKLYNKATVPTVGTDTPFMTLALAPSAAFVFRFDQLYMSTGISYALTTGAADADTGALTLADIVGLNIAYQ